LSVAVTAPLEPADESPAPPARSRFTTWLLVIAGGGLLLRLMNIYWWRPTTNRTGWLGYKLGGDAFFYHWQADAIGNGHFFINPVRWHFEGLVLPSAAHPPLYSTYLGIWSAVGLDGVTAHRVASSLLGTVSIVLIGLLARRLGGNAAGLLAAGIAALYPEIWINDGMLLSETMAIFMTVIALTAAYVFWKTPTMRHALLLGLACGFTALARTELIFLFPILVIPLALLVRDAEWRTRVKLALAACIVGGLVIAPWVVFNMTRFDKFTTLTTGTGSALSSASCDDVYYGKYIGYYANCFHGPYPPQSADESVRDIEPRRQAIAYTKAHWRRIPLVVAARVGRLWGLFKPGQTTALDWWIEGRGRAPVWIGLFSYYALMPFAVFGLIVLRRRRIPILPLLSVAIIATLAAAITFGVTRYRAPAEVSLVIAAAIGIDAAWRKLRDRRAAVPASQ
jgi:4-amino-4-deoxy-L-arabinose transferase-like glycosyltransferase